jgi:hypothetical protein
MEFRNSYTTTEKFEADKLLDEKEQTEKNKILVSNDAFAIGDMIQNLIKKIEHARISLIK